VIADSLVFGFDRDRGVAWLETGASFKPPADAARIDYNTTHVGENKAEQALVHAVIGGRSATVELQLGSAISRLRPALGEALGVGAPVRTAIEFDSTGARRTLGVSATPVRVMLGGVGNDHVAVAPYVDRSELPSNEMFFDGTLAEDFLSPFTVYADWNHHRIYLEPRDRSPQTAVRIGRWADLARCPHLGCVTVELTAPPTTAPPSGDAAAFAPPSAPPAAPTGVLHVTRDRGATMALEIRLRAVGHDDLPDLVAELPAGVHDVVVPIRGDLAAAPYEVVDASPFASPCPAPGGCVHGN